MKKKITDIFLGLIFLIGLSLIIYPVCSNLFSSQSYNDEISSYTQIVDNLDDEKNKLLLEEAIEYNSKLLKSNDYTEIKINNKSYNDILKTGKTDVIAYIKIDKLNVKLPIYHGTTEGTLEAGVGHLEWTSLPVGGIGTHSVLVGHRGLPASKLFSDLDKMKVGDYFEIQVLNERLYYQVDDVSIVEPKEVSELKINKDEDYVTLLTCTPYGINTHRLLVRGKRVDSKTEEEIVLSAAYKLDFLSSVKVFILPISLIVLIIIMISYTFYKKVIKKKRIRDI